MKRTPFTRTASIELVALRVSIGLLCQTAGVETDDLPILDKNFTQLCEAAKRYERGWNTLATKLHERLKALNIPKVS